jgi:CRP-like cAMP-binding protein
MAHTTSSVFENSTDGSPSTPADRSLIHNQLLLAIPREEYELLSSALEYIEMPIHSVVNQMGEPIEYGYFVDSGLVSILTVLAGDKSVEVGMTGKEGFVGLPLVVGLRTSATRAIVQVAGSAFRVSAPAMTRLLPECPQLQTQLNRYSQEVNLQSTQVAACNQLHDVNQRMARWLLMSQDRVGDDLIPLTQQFLAHMLGTRRASVTVAAGVLQKAGLIRYSRGLVTILKRSQLEAAACECYKIMTRQSQNWHNESR